MNEHRQSVAQTKMYRRQQEWDLHTLVAGFSDQLIASIKDYNTHFEHKVYAAHIGVVIKKIPDTVVGLVYNKHKETPKMYNGIQLGLEKSSIKVSSTAEGLSAIIV